MDILKYFGILFIGSLCVNHVCGGCVEDITTQDQNYIRCVQGFANIFQSLAQSGDLDLNAIMGAICSPKGKKAMSCLTDYINKCPELAGSSMVGMNFTEIELQGGIDVYCELVRDDCMPIFQRCMAAAQPPPGAEMGMEMSPYYAIGGDMPTPYSVIPMQIAAACGPMSDTLNCIFDSFDKCPNTAKKMEAKIKEISDNQRQSRGPYMTPSFEEMKNYIQNECPSLPDMQDKGQCLITSTSSPEFVECYQNVIQNKEKDCDVYFGGKQCVMKFVEPVCGKEYADVLVDASHFSPEIPSNCETETKDESTSQESMPKETKDEPTSQGSVTKVCGHIDIRNHVEEFQELINCTVIEGSLQIVLIDLGQPEDYATFKFPDLVEITDYLLLYRVSGLRSLRDIFPNLAVIRGEQLFGSYALVVYEMPCMEELGLVSLRTIPKGAVRLERNPNLCFVETIDWMKITTGIAEGDNLFKNNKDSTECVYSCPEACTKTVVNGILEPRCWTRNHCQQIYSCGPNNDCVSGLCNGTICCSESCLGGCTGPTSTECVACKHVVQYPRSEDKMRVCSDTCSLGTIKLKHWRCIRPDDCLNFTEYEQKEPFKLVLNEANEPDECVEKCPLGYKESDADNSLCVPCRGTCSEAPVSECGTRTVRYNHPRDVGRELDRCIGGALEVRLDNLEVSESDLEQNFEAVEEVKDYIRIYHSDTLTSLRFFKNLKLIRGENLYQGRYALVVFHNPNLQDLFLENVTNQLVWLNGTFLIEHNPQLCYDKIDTFISATRPQNMITVEDTSKLNETNGDQIPCDARNVRKIEGFTVKNISPKFTFLSWEPVVLPAMHLIGYNVIYKEVPTGNVSVCNSNKTCTKEKWHVKELRLTAEDVMSKAWLHGLKGGTRYAIFLRTVTIPKAAGRHDSDLLYFRTDIKEPSNPTNLRVAAESPGQLHLTWGPPSMPNGIVTHYEVTWQLMSWDAKMFDLKDVCVNASTIDLKVLEHELQMEQCGGTNILLEARKKYPPRTRNEVRFQDFLQNQVYVKRERQNKSIPKLSSQPIAALRKLNPQPDVVLTKALVYKTVVYGDTELYINNLGHFLVYNISVKACHDLDRDNAERGKLCSTGAKAIGRTQPDRSAEKVSLLAVAVTVHANRSGIAHIQWDDPQNPNGLIVSYEIEYSKFEIHSLKFNTTCITNAMYRDVGKKGYSLKNLAPGDYIFRMRATSLAGNGPWTEYMSFSVSKVTEQGCPVCPSETPADEELQELIVGSSAVFKAVVGRRQGFPVKVKANIRTYKKRVIDAFVHYKMGENCACPVLNMTERKALIFTSNRNLDRSGQRLTMDQDTVVLRYTKSLEDRVRQMSRSVRKLDRKKVMVRGRSEES